VVWEAGSELCLRVGGRREGFAPFQVFEDFVSLTGVVGEGVYGSVGVEETKVGCGRVKGCVKLLLSLHEGEVGVHVGEGEGEREGVYTRPLQGLSS
jgi:hypothetical protein